MYLEYLLIVFIKVVCYGDYLDVLWIQSKLLIHSFSFDVREVPVCQVVDVYLLCSFFSIEVPVLCGHESVYLAILFDLLEEFSFPGGGGLFLNRSVHESECSSSFLFVL